MNLRTQLQNLTGLGIVLAGFTLYAVFFFQLTVNGIILGSIYALIALGYSMVYGILKLLNFAHGDVYMIGSFIGFGILTLLGGALSPAIPVVLLVLIMFVAAMLGSGVLGVAIERFAYRPLRNAPRIVPLISALGVAFFLENSALLLFGAQYRNYDGYDLISYNGIHIGGVTGIFVSYLGVIVISTAVVLMVALVCLVRFTRFGKAMRAVSFDREAAAMMGIDTDRVIAKTFFAGSALAGAAGVMFGLLFSQIYYLIGFLAGLKGFTAPATGQIGVDSWVSESGERQQRYTGPWGQVARVWDRLPPAGKLALITPAILVPFIPFVSTGNLFNYGIFILIYALLALGLNVVVGFAGLLDLGYVAFFGFGAYTYAFLSGTHSEKGHTYTHHWDAQYSIPVCVAICALLGLFLGSSSRRLLGDYLAIVTLFFGQAFVVFTNAADPFGLTNGSGGLANVDPLRVFGGHVTIHTTRGYYWFLLGVVVLLLIVLHFLSDSRTGRACKSSREDPLAAELMGVPVNRLKIMAFSFGAGIAGLAGSIFAAVQTGAFPQNFGTAVLILIYAVVILGGTGSLTGMIVGAIVIIASNQALDSTSPPNQARVLFYAVLIAAVLLTMKTWPKRIAALAGAAAFGLVVREVVGALWTNGTKGQVTSGGFLTDVIEHWVLIPENPHRVAVWGYLLLIACIVVLVQLKGWWRIMVLVPTLTLTAFVWENLLIVNPAVTRSVLFGVLLIAVMSVRPEGLFGQAKVEVV